MNDTTVPQGTDEPQPPIDDTFRRIRNIVHAFPTNEWTADEAQEVLKALSLIVRGRPFNGGVR
jgi:hypothetical protein